MMPARRGTIAAAPAAAPASRWSPATNAVQSSAAGRGSVQPTTSASRLAGADSVRRRLSSIFQRPISGRARRRSTDGRVAPAEEPRQQLPVAARPAMLARGGHVVARGKLLDDLDVGGEPGARKDALEQVVAEQRAVGTRPASAASNASTS